VRCFYFRLKLAFSFPLPFLLFPSLVFFSFSFLSNFLLQWPPFFYGVKGQRRNVCYKFLQRSEDCRPGESRCSIARERETRAVVIRLWLGLRLTTKKNPTKNIQLILLDLKIPCE